MIHKRVIRVKYLTKLLRRGFISGLYELPHAVFEKKPDRVTVIFDDSGVLHYVQIFETQKAEKYYTWPSYYWY